MSVFAGLFVRRPGGTTPINRRLTLERLEDRTVPSAFEVWTIDQSNSRDENANGSLVDPGDSGGTLYVYRGADLEGRHAARAVPDVIDLGGAARDLSVARTGTAPIRPHMLTFSPDHTHAIVTFVASGHVLFLDAATRAPVGVVDVGVQAHAAVPTQDGKYVIVANQNGKLLQRIATNYRTNTFTLDDTLDLANGTTPSGAPRQDPLLRPDNAPICPVVDSSGRFAFVTLRGGGLFVVDVRARDMAIVAEYDQATVKPNGCGGAEVNGKVYINSGGGTAANPHSSDLYAFRVDAFSRRPSTTPNTPAPKVVFSHTGDHERDAHGTTLTRHGRYLWMADRAANTITVVDTRNDRVVNEFSLVGAASYDPTPDLLGVSPAGNRVFASLRGPHPLSGNVPNAHNAEGTTPGVGVIKVVRGGRHGVLQSVARITHVLDGVERADPHALGVRLVRHGHRQDPPRHRPLLNAATDQPTSAGASSTAAAAAPPRQVTAAGFGRIAIPHPTADRDFEQGPVENRDEDRVQAAEDLLIAL
jgi:hypothetical protein